jgi:hypothetical protein
MDILSLLGLGQQQPKVAPPAPAQAPQAPAAVPANYDAFLKLMQSGAQAQGWQADPNNLLSWITGSAKKLAADRAAAAAPSAWQQYQAAQSALQNGQLGTAQNFATNDAMTGTNIDPNNPMASVPDMAKAYAGVLSPQGSAPAQGGATQGQPEQTDPLAAQRAFYQRMGRFSQMRGDTAGANEYFKLAGQGIPDGTATLPTGQVADAISGKPVTGDVAGLLANRAGRVSAAETAPKVAGQMRVAGNQAGLDRQTHAQENADDARYKQVTGFDKATGQPMTISQADLTNGRAGNFVQGDNPFFAGQQAELKELRTKNESAEQGLDLAQQISNAANGVFTGKGAGTLQDVRKFAQAAGQLTGVNVGDDILNDTSKFEQLKFASQQLVAVASHSLSPRVAMNIYNQIASVKPGDASSIKGLRDIINNQIIPAMQRDKAMYAGASKYYKTHPTANDAMTVVPGQNPLQNFGVKDVHKAQPGDLYIDPASGNLRQRPMQ